MPLISTQKDRASCLKKWESTRLSNLSQLSGERPKDMCMDELRLTVCCRYAQDLIQNVRIRKYLCKYHFEKLKTIEEFIRNFEQHR